MKKNTYNDVEDKLFHQFKIDNKGCIDTKAILNSIKNVGINTSIHKIVSIMHNISTNKLSFNDFVKLINKNNKFILRLLSNELAINNFSAFVDQITDIFNNTKHNDSGKVADYIPQLARIDAEKYGISICSIDGQEFSIGDANEEFCVQSCSKPITYGLAIEEHGLDVVHKYVGREPSGRGFNAFVLNYHGLPHNPMINSGSIMTSSLICPNLNNADRFDYILNIWKRLSGNGKIGFDNPTYLSEKETADRNFALAYFMNENKAFPSGVNLQGILDLYFQMCSISINTKYFARIAATFANGGRCPITDDQVFQSDTIRSCLSLMYSCGMYDYSGEFAFRYGVPAKSGVSGVLLVVIPNIVGICIWSPKLDRLGNSVRGIKFVEKLIKSFNYHIMDQLVPNLGAFSIKNKMNNKIDLMNLYYAAANGDLKNVKILVAKGVNLSQSDYDGRTALHLAASEGHLHIVEYLLKNNVETNVIDRWNSTPLQDAIRHKHNTIIDFLKKYK